MLFVDEDWGKDIFLSSSPPCGGKGAGILQCSHLGMEIEKHFNDVGSNFFGWAGSSYLSPSGSLQQMQSSLDIKH